MQTTQRLYRLDRSEIAFVKFIFEAYDGIATLSTIDREMGIVRLLIAPGCEKTVSELIEDLRHTVRIESWLPIAMESHG